VTDYELEKFTDAVHGLMATLVKLGVANNETIEWGIEVKLSSRLKDFGIKHGRYKSNQERPDANSNQPNDNFS
jgi:hypothetical protein